MAATPPVCDFGWRAPDFHLRATDGRVYSFADVKGANGTLIMFISNHCPYVKAVLDRIIRDARDLTPLGVGVAAICSNDAAAYPEDGFEMMARIAKEKQLPFPYCHDETQSVARAYGAVCTPDFFAFDGDGGLQYRGRLDASRKEAGPPDLRRDLFEAIKEIAATGRGPETQIPSIGCSIKWKAA
ncbi:MAG: thioredoxin family protein [Parvularculaceae bacterium]